MDVDDKHCYYDGECDEDHNEKKILSYQRDDFRRRWDDIFNNKEKHGEGHKHGGGEGKLFSFVRREIEDQHGEERQPETWDDKKECVEEWETFQYKRICDIGVGINVVTPAAPLSGGVEYFPLAVVKEVFTVYVMVNQRQVHHSAIIRPGAKLHGTVLSVEGKKGDIHGTGRFIAGGRSPHDGTIESYNGFGH